MRPRPPLRVAFHRGTTAHVASVYPFSVQASFGHRGAYVGVDVLAGGTEFCFDPFEAYAAGLVTNPNAWILGEPGNGKSALVKCLLWRMAGIYGTGRRVAVVDPKGEYVPLAQRLGLTVVRPAPGGDVRVNPLDDTASGSDEPDERAVLRRAAMVTALTAAVLERPLTQVEDAAVFASVEHLVCHRRDTATLGDVAALLAAPPAEMTARLRRRDDELTAELSPVTYGLDKLLTRSLRGMFDGPSTVALDPDGPGLVLDLSAVPLDSEALPLVMVAATGWLSQLMTGPTRRRVQILDEAWALLGNRHTAGYLQTAFKLGRAHGIANLAVAHRASDLGAQADDGTATAKIACGLVADAATKIVLRQAPDQLDLAAATFGLSNPQRAVVSQLTRGRALWDIGGRTAVVQHLMTDTEAALCDTDAAMTGNPGGFLHTGPPAEVEAA